MYSVSLYNGQNEVIIHYPSSNSDDPHVNKLPLKEIVSSVDSLTFSLFPNNPGYNSVFELTTRVKAFDVRDNTVRFTGRILSIDEKMDNDGTIYKDITCEGAMSYLNDTKQRGSSISADTGASFISQMLDIHNSKVEDYRKIYVGEVTVGKDIIHGCEFKTTLAEILDVVGEQGGGIRIRESNNRLYLDWKDSFDPNTISITLGINMKEIVKSKDITSLGSRIIPLGANNLTIESVNGGKDYLEDSSTVNKYGVIEKTVEYKDIEDATTLMNTCLNDLSNYTQASYVLSTNALDLSYLTGNKAEQFKLGTKLHIVNEYMGIDDNYSITEISLDLLKPYNPTLTISNKVTKLTNTISDLRKETIQNDGVYNNVQIGKSFGIRAVRNDQKVVTTINATDGISIENNKEKIFYVDVDGKLVAVKIEAKGGTFRNIDVRTGTFTNITIEEGLLIEDGDTSCEINSEGVKLTGTNGEEANIQILDDNEYSGTYILDDLYVEDVLRVFGRARFENNVTCYQDLLVDGDLEVTGNISIGGDDLEDYVNDLIKQYSEDKGWE